MRLEISAITMTDYIKGFLEQLTDDSDEQQHDLRVLVDTLSQCSDRLAALAFVEDGHFEKSSEMDAFIKSTVLRNANRSIIGMLADIRDHFREVL